MKGSKKQFLLTAVVSVAAAVAVYALLRFTAPRWHRQQSASAPASLRHSTDTWEEAVAKVKEERVESSTQPAIEVPHFCHAASQRNDKHSGMEPAIFEGFPGFRRRKH